MKLYFDELFDDGFYNNSYLEIQNNEEIVLLANHEGILLLVDELIKLCNTNVIGKHYHIDEYGMAYKSDKPMIITLSKAPGQRNKDNYRILNNTIFWYLYYFLGRPILDVHCNAIEFIRMWDFDRCLLSTNLNLTNMYAYDDNSGGGPFSRMEENFYAGMTYSVLLSGLASFFIAELHH